MRLCMDGLDWNLVRAFRATAEAGSLSAAARVLRLTQPTLSRQIAALEASLGATLFDRIGKRLVLTVTGLSLIEHARAMGAAAETLELAAAGRAEEVSGAVRISATDAFSAYLLPDIFARIRQAAPQVALTISASNALSDLRRREADIAIRHVRPTEPELIGRLVCEMEARFYASESWVRANGMPASRASLSGHDLMGMDPPEQFSAHLRGIGVDVPPEAFRVMSDSAVTLWEMARKGLGICIMLPAIANRYPEMVEVLGDSPAAIVPVWLVTHREMRTSRRIRVVFDTLATEITRGLTAT
jgi:DNA-binding transcriptional LysR family regulator